MRASPVALVVAFGFVLAAACGPGNATGPGAVVAPTDSDAGLGATMVDATVPDPVVPTPSASATDSATPTAPQICGCSLCQPIVSDDACSTDADCAPSALCHAPACIAKAKAPVRGKTNVCTQIMACASTDANTCGCLQGKCALSPRAKP